MDVATKGAVTSTFWPSGQRASPWAILDLARTPRIHTLLTASGLDHLCLYSGQLPREMQMAAPHIVELPRGHRFVDQLLDEGWGNSWGVFVKIADPTQLRPHLRRFLKVKDEAGRSLIFRYYDPRVLRVYLPTCTPEELKTVFGPLDSYLVEGPDGRSLIEFRLGPQGLEQRDIPLDAPQVE